jgi:heme exporter protein A
MPSPERAIGCRGLVRRFGERLALNGIDLDVAAGETVLVTGPNGAGKTTLLRVLSTVLRATSGEVQVAGRALPREARAARPLIGYAGHDPLVYPGLTARENLDLYASLYDLDGTAAAAALARVELEERSGDLASELSRGMLQRLSLARATLHNPSVLLLDEPTTGLDSGGQQVLDRLLAEGRMTVVIASHEPSRFAPGAREVRLEDGRVAG